MKYAIKKHSSVVWGGYDIMKAARTVKGHNQPLEDLSVMYKVGNK